MDSTEARAASVLGAVCKSCIGRVFNFKIGCFIIKHSSGKLNKQPHLELKTFVLFAAACPWIPIPAICQWSGGAVWRNWRQLRLNCRGAEFSWREVVVRRRRRRRRPWADRSKTFRRKWSFGQRYKTFFIVKVQLHVQFLAIFYKV
jgi:hypothetical protein